MIKHLIKQHKDKIKHDDHDKQLIAKNSITWFLNNEDTKRRNRYKDKFRFRKTPQTSKNNSNSNLRPYEKPSKTTIKIARELVVRKYKLGRRRRGPRSRREPGSDCGPRLWRGPRARLHVTPPRGSVNADVRDSQKHRKDKNKTHRTKNGKMKQNARRNALRKLRRLKNRETGKTHR